MRTLQRAAVVTATAIGLVGVGVGSAWAGTPAPQPTTPNTVAAAHPATTVRQAAQQTVAGTVLRTDGRSVQVRDRSGRVTVVQVDARTVVTKNGRSARLTDVRALDRVTVTAQRNGSALLATRIVDSGR